MKLFKRFVFSAVLVAGLLTFSGAVLAEDAAAPAAAAPAVTDAAAAPADDAILEEEEEKELTYQEQAVLLIDTVIEDYTVRMAALQAIIDMKDDEIAGNKDTIKKAQDLQKKLNTAVKTGQSVSKSLRPVLTALPDGDAKTDAIASLDRLDAAIVKALEQ